MKKETVSRAVDGIDAKFIDEAAAFALPSAADGARENDGSVGAKRRRLRRIGWAAVCAALIAIACSAAYAVAAEAREYGKAIAFFEENGLSADGLSRSEVKAVYRDITTKSFTNEKTAEVLRASVPGWEIAEEEPAPEELAALWDQNAARASLSGHGIEYRVDYRYALDERRGFEILEESVLECLKDGEPLWSASFTDFLPEGWSYAGGMTVVWGMNTTYSYEDTARAWVALADGEGNILWQRCLDHGFRYEYAAAVLRGADGAWAVFTRGDSAYLCLTRLDDDGRELGFQKTEVGNYGIRGAARLGDGYIVQLWNGLTGDTALLYRMDREGNVTSSYRYEADDCDYYLTDMIEFEGRIYLSAYAVPKQTDPGGRHEIADILASIFSREGGWDISEEELTPLVRDNYTAVLLLCDPEGGEPKTFYSVKGSLGGKLAVNGNGELEWDAESLTSAFFSPATSSFTIGASCAVYRYVFDAAGTLIGRADTGEVVPYRR